MNEHLFEIKFYYLEAKFKELLETKNKAIKFVKENACYDKETKKCNDDLNYNECDELLEILGDKENDKD